MIKGKTIEISVKEPVEKEDIELVRMIADQLSVRDIAKKKGISHRTIESQIAVLKKKYHVRTSIGLVVLFYRHKLIN